MSDRKIILVILIIISIGLLYYFPIQKYLAEKTFSEYIALQGAKEENIQSKRVFKDYK